MSLVDEIISRLLKKPAFLKKMTQCRKAVACLERELDAEIKPGTWSLDLTDAQRQYFIDLDYKELKKGRDSLDGTLGAKSADYYFTDW